MRQELEIDGIPLDAEEIVKKLEDKQRTMEMMDNPFSCFYEGIMPATSIGEFAFAGCSNLASIVIPEGVTSIEYCAFAFCTSLTTITIPKSMTNVGKNAFSACISLTDVYCYSEEVPDANNESFNYPDPSILTLHVPKSAIDQYKKTEPWCRFGKIILIE